MEVVESKPEKEETKIAIENNEKSGKLEENVETSKSTTNFSENNQVK